MSRHPAVGINCPDEVAIEAPHVHEPRDLTRRCHSNASGCRLRRKAKRCLLTCR